jgi:hypothetical protein
MTGLRPVKPWIEGLFSACSEAGKASETGDGSRLCADDGCDTAASADAGGDGAPELDAEIAAIVLDYRPRNYGAVTRRANLAAEVHPALGVIGNRWKKFTK